MGVRDGATAPSRPVLFFLYFFELALGPVSPSLRKYLFYLLRVIIKCAPRRLIGIDCVNKFIVDNKCLITPSPDPADTRRPGTALSGKWQRAVALPVAVAGASECILPSISSHASRTRTENPLEIQKHFTAISSKSYSTLNAINRMV